MGTFADTFEEATLWNNVGFEPYGQSAYSLLVATTEGAPIDPARIAARLAAPAVREALAPWGLGTTTEVLECLHAGPATLDAWARGLPRNTDDHPLVQFVTHYTDAAPMTPDRLLEAFAPEEAPLDAAAMAPLRDEMHRRWAAQGLLLAGHLARAAEICEGCAKPPMFEAAMREGLPYYHALGERYRDDPERLLEVAAGLLLHGALGDAETFLEEATGHADDPKLWLHLGLVRAAEGDYEGASDAYHAALRRDPNDPLIQIDLGRALVAQELTDRAVFAFERAIDADGSLAEAHTGLALALMAKPRRNMSPESELREALRLDPRSREASVLLGRLNLGRRRPEEAASVLRAGLAYHPYDTDLLFDLAVAERGRGDEDAARAALGRVLFIDPEDAGARALFEELEAGAGP